MNFYKHFIGDYQRDTMRLSMIEDGAYRRLMDEYYATDEPLPLDINECYRAARAISQEEKKAVDKILARYFKKSDDGYRHKRIDNELAKAQAYADAQSMRAHMRWDKQTDMPDESPEDTSHSQNHSHIPKTNNQNIGKKFTPPEKQEVIQFFLDNGYSEQSGKTAFEYYHEGKWKDSEGKPVKNWKQKMRGVWFKPGNKSHDPAKGAV